MPDPIEPRRDAAGRIICLRCLASTSAHTMSMFSTDTICLECKDIEREHPRYAEAERAERAAVRAGDRHFAGIGVPRDLVATSRAARRGRDQQALPGPAGRAR